MDTVAIGTNRGNILPGLILTTLLWMSSGCGDPGPGPKADLLDPWVERAYDPELLPGMSVVVVEGDEVAYLRGFGYADREAERPVTPETVFYIASATKSFLGMAASMLDERGEVDLDGTLADHLPGTQLTPPLSAEDISLRDLLTHTHGISNNSGLPFRLAFTGEWTFDVLLRLLSEIRPARNGRSFEYGNVGYNIAAMAMDRSEGISWQDLLEQELFEPLGMASTTAYISRIADQRRAMPYRTEPGGPERTRYAKFDSNMQSAGGLVTTTLDLARWLEANLNDGRVDGKQVIPAAAVEEAHRPHAETDGDFFGFTRKAYSLGWYHGEYDGDRFLHHFGGFSGFHAHVSFMPDRKIGVAVLANESSAGAMVASTVAKGIYDLLLEKADLASRQEEQLEQLASIAQRRREGVIADRDRRAGRPQTLPHPLAAYTGGYENPEFGTMEWRLDGDALGVRMGVAESDVEVYDGENNRLRVELTGGGGVVEFEFGSGEVAERLRYAGRVFERAR